MSIAITRRFSRTVHKSVALTAPLVALLLVLSPALPAHAQLPRILPPVTVMATPVVEIDTGVDGSPLTLLANHVDIRVVGSAARVRTTLTWRNDGATPIAATFRAPLPSALAQLKFDDAIDGCGDLPDVELQAMDDESVETGDAPARGHGVVHLAPGEEVRVTVERETTLIARGDHHRIVLPLFTQRGGLFTPRFSATASIDAARPIVDLTSATHPIEVDRLGDSQALVVVSGGRVHEGQFLALDFTLGTDATVVAATATSAPTAQRWGGEGLARIASR